MQLHGVPHANIYVMVFFVRYIVTTLNLCDARKGSSMDFMDTMPMEFDIPQFELEDEYPDSSSNSFLCEGFTGNSCMMMLLENNFFFIQWVNTQAMSSSVHGNGGLNPEKHEFVVLSTMC